MEKSLNSTTLFALNALYFLSRYLLSHVAFMFLYTWVIVEMGTDLAYQTIWVKVLAYLSITAWFMWGLRLTRQPKFLFAGWFLFMGSQTASFADFPALASMMIVLCVLLCASKLYFSRHKNAAYMMQRWA